MKVYVNAEKTPSARDPMIYGHFIEHFHRQIYGGVYDPGNPLSDEAGLRQDVLQAMRDIRVPVLRWPGGCFVSAYHWKNGVGKERIPHYDKAWRVEDPNSFGTDEYLDMCRKIGCEPYICTNAGTGTAEEMSDWVEYCNLDHEGQYARMRIANGHPEPYGVKYWSIGNENYGYWEIGAKSAQEWGRLTAEAAKMMRRTDPSVQLSAAALTDPEWNMNLLKNCGRYLSWISIHDYWDPIHETNDAADYETCMVYTKDIGKSVRKVRGLLEALGLEKQISIAYDEWNLRQWYHPNIMELYQGLTKEEYLKPRDDNDINSTYTMADAVFTACFLNMCNRNCNIVRMANFSPIVNTRGCIFTYPEGIVLRSTYYVFYLYVNYLGDLIPDFWTKEEPSALLRGPDGKEEEIDLLDVLVTAFSDGPGYAVAAVNKDAEKEQLLELSFDASGPVRMYSLCGDSKDAYNDVGHTGVSVKEENLGLFSRGMSVSLKPHSINVIQIRER